MWLFLSHLFCQNLNSKSYLICTHRHLDILTANLHMQNIGDIITSQLKVQTRQRKDDGKTKSYIDSQVLLFAWNQSLIQVLLAKRVFKLTITQMCRNTYISSNFPFKQLKFICLSIEVAKFAQYFLQPSENVCILLECVCNLSVTIYTHI